MTLSAQDRRRYARHISLPEIGEVGQERLLAAHVKDVPNPTTLDYLRRAGVSVEHPTAPLRSPDFSTSSKREGESGGEGAALVGAFEAVERIKEILGVGIAGKLEGFE